MNKRKNRLLREEENRRELGFGSQASNDSNRLINKDGSFNIQREGVSFWSKVNIYHRLITCSWGRFFALIGLYFAITNFFFAFLYEIIGVEKLNGAELSTPWLRFMDAFFFSTQTLTTVGYGRIAPVGLMMSFVAAIESLIGLLTFALITGLLYGRFSRPVARILYSNVAVIAPYLDTTAFMFRIINERANQLIDISVEVNLALTETTKTGKSNRKYVRLHLERNQVNFFPANWTLVHPLTEDSPIFGLSLEDLKQKNAEFLILIKATEDTFNQTVHSRTSYHANDIAFGAKFSSMVKEEFGKHTLLLDISKLSDIEEAPLASDLLLHKQSLEMEKEDDQKEVK
jgi:inward rectifier potassium channel